MGHIQRVNVCSVVVNMLQCSSHITAKSIAGLVNIDIFININRVLLAMARHKCNASMIRNL